MRHLLLCFQILLIIFSAGCNRSEPAAVVVPPAASRTAHESSLQINPETRIVLDGGLRDLTLRYETWTTDGWHTAAVCAVARLTSPETPVEQGAVRRLAENIIETYSQEGNKGFRSATFYHRKTALLIHQMTCDQPGFLNVSARLERGKVVGSGQMLGVEDRPASLWLIPFESSVTAENDSLVIQREGGLVVVMAVGTQGERAEDIASRWSRICRQYDTAGGDQPDVVKVVATLQQEVETGDDAFLNSH